MEHIYVEPPKPNESLAEEVEESSPWLFKLGQVIAGVLLIVTGICTGALVLSLTAKIIFWLFGLGF